MAKVAGTRGVSAQMNVTPLVDVLLVLLIIFMITPRTDPHGLDAKVPEESKVETPKQIDTMIVLRVRQDGDQSSLRINQSDVAWADLRERLRDIYKARATKVMFIQGDKEVEFAHIARAMDTARAADRDITIGLVTRSLSGD